MVWFGEPVTIRFPEFKEKIDQVGFTLDRIELEGFGRVEARQGGPTFVLDPSGQSIPLRVNAVAQDIRQSASRDLIWIRGYYHGWRNEAASQHLSLTAWRPTTPTENER